MYTSSFTRASLLHLLITSWLSGFFIQAFTSPMSRDMSKLHKQKFHHAKANFRPNFLMRHDQEDVGGTLESSSESTIGKNINEMKSRRNFLKQTIGSVGVVSLLSPVSVLAEELEDIEIPFSQQKSLDSSIYTILRVREATSQETRLISTGKFKDVQRANVKLAVKFMLQNYRLGDNFITASSYLESPSRRIEAGDIGQQAVQSLYTILEYFDSSDVQNIQVNSSGMAGKEPLVLKGLETARSRIDDFLNLFPPDIVAASRAKIKEENELNAKEFDPEIGTILNPNPAPKQS